MARENWIRVGRKHCCPICGHSDWCLVSIDGTAAICPRIESSRRVGDSGWLHRIEDYRTFPIRRPIHAPLPCPARIEVDWATYNRELVNGLGDELAQELSETIGISQATLRKMEWGWSPRQSVFTTPMRSADGKIIGIRTRSRSGSKRAISSSKSGLFFCPEIVLSNQAIETLLVCEGPTDTAALIDAGLPFVIGRPSCNSGLGIMAELFTKLAIGQLIIVADSDTPGLRGASILATELINRDLIDAHSVGLCIPPIGIKDCRDWYRQDTVTMLETISYKIRELQTQGSCIHVNEL